VSRVIKAMMRHPKAMMKYQQTGRLPREVRITQTPLLVALKKIPPRLRCELKGFRVDPSLGYRGSRTFRSAEQAFRWLVGHENVRLDCQPRLASESWIDPRFNGPLSWEQVRENVHGTIPPATEARIADFFRRP